jgi:NAD(P)-dependent dehydrogenase (short-subunit alcohol dehydrogenase family)
MPTGLGSRPTFSCSHPRSPRYISFARQWRIVHVRLQSNVTAGVCAFATIRAEVGSLDVLFANAGLGGIEPLGEITEAQFDLTFGVNVQGTLFTVQKALPLMQAGGSTRKRSSL